MKGKATKLKGRAKERVGEITNDQQAQKEGSADQVTGEAQETWAVGSGAPARLSRTSEIGSTGNESDIREEAGMLLTVAVVLLIAWLLGMVGAYTIGAFIHVLLIAAVVLFLFAFAKGRRTVV